MKIKLIIFYMLVLILPFNFLAYINAENRYLSLNNIKMKSISKNIKRPSMTYLDAFKIIKKYSDLRIQEVKTNDHGSIDIKVCMNNNLEELEGIVSKLKKEKGIESLNNLSIRKTSDKINATMDINFMTMD